MCKGAFPHCAVINEPKTCLNEPGHFFLLLWKKFRACEVFARKGVTAYAIGLAAGRICESILRDEHSILTISGLINGEYGIHNVCFSLPSIVNRQGRSRVLPVPLAPNEEASLHHSAAVLNQCRISWICPSPRLRGREWCERDGDCRCARSPSLAFGKEPAKICPCIFPGI